MADIEVEEIDGDLEVAEMEKIVAIQEVEVEVIVENTMVVVIVEVIVGAIPGVVVLLVIVQICMFTEVIGKSYWSSER